MIKWAINLLYQCLEFQHNKRKMNICKSSCLFCESWEDCKFMEDIDLIQTAMTASYDDGYKDGLNDAEYKTKRV